MSFKMIDYNHMKDNINVHYFGWSQSEIDILNKSYQSKFLGGTRDARFYCIDDEGNEYYAIFRGYLGEDGEIAAPKLDWLSFKDNKRVLLNVFGRLYRFVINDKICLSIEPFKRFFDSITYPKSYIPSIASNEHEIMIFCEEEIIAISWDKIIWTYSIEDACYCELGKLAIDSQYVYIHRHTIWGKDEITKLSILHGISN